MRVRRRSSCVVVDRLRSIRAEAVDRGTRVFELVDVGGVRVDRPASLGTFENVGAALDRARRFGAVSCVVREWAELPGGVRVHVDSVEWLLSWNRVGGLRRRPIPVEGEAIRPAAPPGLAGRGLAERPPERRQPFKAF